MVNPNRQPDTKDTAQALRDALDQQAKHFNGMPDPLPPAVDEAFWQANHEVLRAVREHEAAKRGDEPLKS